MFFVVISACLAADPQVCETHGLTVPQHVEYTACLTAAENAATLWARQNRRYAVRHSYCLPVQPGQGR